MKHKTLAVDSLTPQQESAILSLVAQPTISRAAQACGVPERTVYRWMKLPEFQNAYREARRDSFSQAIGLCQRATPVAVNVLAKIMSDPTAPYTSRVAAAIAVLKFGRESLEIDDLAARIAALETQVTPQGEVTRITVENRDGTSEVVEVSEADSPQETDEEGRDKSEDTTA